MQYKVEIRGLYYGKSRTFPDWNNVLASHNAHYQKGAKMKRDYQMICSYAIRKQLKGVKIARPIKITYYFYEVDKKRDLGNLTYVDKCFCDALQTCKVIENDNPQWIRELHFICCEPDKKNPRITIIMEEIE